MNYKAFGSLWSRKTWQPLIQTRADWLRQNLTSTTQKLLQTLLTKDSSALDPHQLLTVKALLPLFTLGLVSKEYSPVRTRPDPHQLLTFPAFDLQQHLTPSNTISPQKKLILTSISQSTWPLHTVGSRNLDTLFWGKMGSGNSSSVDDSNSLVCHSQPLLLEDVPLNSPPPHKKGIDECPLIPAHCFSKFLELDFHLLTFGIRMSWISIAWTHRQLTPPTSGHYNAWDHKNSLLN